MMAAFSLIGTGPVPIIMAVFMLMVGQLRFAAAQPCFAGVGACVGTTADQRIVLLVHQEQITYEANPTTNQGLPDFQGADLGTFNMNSDKAELVFKGGKAVFVDDGSPSVDTVELCFNLRTGAQVTTFCNDLTGTPTTGASVFSSLDYNFYIHNSSFVQTNGAGSYTMEVLYREFTTDPDQYDSNSGSDYIASFTIVDVCFESDFGSSCPMYKAPSTLELTSNSFDRVAFTAVCESTSGEYAWRIGTIKTGTTSDALLEDLYLAKVDTASGIVLLDAQFDYDDGEQLGQQNANEESFSACVVDSSDNLFVVGHARQTGVGVKDETFLLKFDSSGSYLTGRRFEKDSNFARFNDVALSTDEDHVLVGGYKVGLHAGSSGIDLSTRKAVLLAFEREDLSQNLTVWYDFAGSNNYYSEITQIIPNPSRNTFYVIGYGRLTAVDQSNVFMMELNSLQEATDPLEIQYVCRIDEGGTTDQYYSTRSSVLLSADEVLVSGYYKNGATYSDIFFIKVSKTACQSKSTNLPFSIYSWGTAFFAEIESAIVDTSQNEAYYVGKLRNENPNPDVSDMMLFKLDTSAISISSSGCPWKNVALLRPNDVSADYELGNLKGISAATSIYSEPTAWIAGYFENSNAAPGSVQRIALSGRVTLNKAIDCITESTWSSVTVNGGAVQFDAKSIGNVAGVVFVSKENDGNADTQAISGTQISNSDANTLSNTTCRKCLDVPDTTVAPTTTTVERDTDITTDQESDVTTPKLPTSTTSITTDQESDVTTPKLPTSTTSLNDKDKNSLSFMITTLVIVSEVVLLLLLKLN